jgi:hypothetical protein
VRRALAIAMTLALLAAPSTALADGDPASDVLLVQDVYEPYQPKVPKPVSDGLAATLKQARVAGYPLKVAIIASKNDLGAVPQFFARPQPYAQFLEREIAFNQAKPLLIVMPNGYGSAEAGAKAPDAIKGLKPVNTSDGDKLGRAAIAGAVALAKANGHAITPPKIAGTSSSGGGGGGTSPAIVFGVPVALLALGGVLAAIRAKQSTGRREDETETVKTKV